jgi:spore coat protein U-like protein
MRTRRFGGIVLGVAMMSVAVDSVAEIDCSLSTTGVAFSIYDPSAVAPNDSTGNVTVTCTYLSGGAQQVAYVASLSTGGSGSYVSRRLQSGANLLNYNLYSDATRTTVWGNGLGGTAVISGSFTVGPGVGNGLRQDSQTVYGRIPARQDVLDGTYTDTIVVTLQF